MSWKPIVVGVDTSPEAASAAAFAVLAAQRAAAACHLVHAAPEVPARGRNPYPYTRLDEQARTQVVAALGNRVPTPVLKALSVRRGLPAAVVRGAVAALGAELVVLGGKHHSTLGRWWGGSTSVNVARSTTVPLLVTAGEPPLPPGLVPVDQSGGARPPPPPPQRPATAVGARAHPVCAVESP